MMSQQLFFDVKMVEKYGGMHIYLNRIIIISLAANPFQGLKKKEGKYFQSRLISIKDVYPLWATSLLLSLKFYPKMMNMDENNSMRYV